MRRGASPFPERLSTHPPIRESGAITRVMGRFLIEASPVSSLLKRCPARIPDNSRMVVPLFPTSRQEEGADRPCSPFP